jgi:hypothetical protein
MPWLSVSCMSSSSKRDSGDLALQVVHWWSRPHVGLNLSAGIAVSAQ